MDIEGLLVKFEQKLILQRYSPTEIYTHITDVMKSKIKSPLDLL